MGQTKALATRNSNETALSAQVQKTAVDPEIIALASAFFTAGEMTKEQAVKAAYFFYQTGQVEGRDSYIGTTGNVSGKVLEGYRGVAREVGRDYEVKYRRPTNDEIEEHGINPKGKALVCEVYVLDIWQRKQAMGLPYEPVIGIAYYPPGTTIRVPATKTEHWVLQKNARKDALRQVPGIPLDAGEVFEEAAAMGIKVEPLPEGAEPSTEQAILMVNQAIRDAQNNCPDWDGIEGQFTETTEPDDFEPEPGEEVWADWKNPAHAKAWAMTQGKFNHGNHMERAYEKVKTDNKPANARDMWRCWYEYVMAHEPAQASETTEDSDEPLFS